MTPAARHSPLSIRPHLRPALQMGGGSGGQAHGCPAGRRARLCPRYLAFCLYYHSGVAVIRIEDAGDPRVADYRNIPDSVLLERRHAFVAEGRLVVRRLLTSNRFVTRSLMVTAPAG